MVYVILVLLGLCLGSFVNALVWRLHEQTAKKFSSKRKKDLSIIRGRSMCVHCQHELKTQDLIPVISWISLGGKCRYCHKKISWQYPLVELLTAALFVFVYFEWNPNINIQNLESYFMLGLLFLAITIGMALAVYDFRWKLLPNRLVSALSVIGFIFAVLNVLGMKNTLGALISLIISIFISGGIFWILYQISSGKWIGGGDVKLGAALGFFLLTPINSFLMIFLASLLGSIFALVYKLTGKYKKQMHIPFGPFLLLATYFIVIYGERIIHLYKDLLYI